jgi:hypothetical protein
LDASGNFDLGESGQMIGSLSGVSREWLTRSRSPRRAKVRMAKAEEREEKGRITPKK